jgi:chromosome segregation ATPase
VDGVETEKELTPVNAEEVLNLQKTLSETTSSLENAKKIIASLENANGSLALDSRSKLKDKEEELSSVQKESEDRKRLLDSLATELRDLQRNQGDIDDADRRTRAQVMKQKALMGHLETSLSDLQAAVVVHEASLTMMDSGIADNSNIEEISEILGDTLHAISATLETTEHYVDEFGDDNSVVVSDVDVSSEVGRHIDSIIRNDREAASQGFKHELDQKKIAVKRLEEALKKQNDEMKKLRSQLEARGRGNYDNNHQLRAEIESLRQQCSTNMEVLAKKERELSVLRSSLKVDDGETGYISDDASDDDDDDDGTEVGSTMSAAKLNSYGPADAEAYATILAQASGRIEMPGRAQQENESLKRDLMEALGEKESASKELQARRESLANAKMIISSLEKANKGMMEDLRSRLQDSNSAIASLLDKSTEHEKAAETLREKLQKSEQEKLEERQKYETEMRKVKKELPSLTKDNTRNDGEKEIPLEEMKEDIPIFGNSI